MAKKNQPIRLTSRKVIDWANAHYVRKGKWPTYQSGRVFEAPDLDWSSIDGCLEFGGLGLPGGSSLAHLLAQHRGLDSGKKSPPLSVELILVWADRHHIRTGKWPTETSGPVMGVPGELWKNIDGALRRGSRGLPGDSSVPQLLAEHRGRRPRDQGRSLTIEQILAWADDYKKRNNVWPTQRSGPVTGVPGESWVNIQTSLRRGLRGLPGGSSVINIRFCPWCGSRLPDSRRDEWFDRVEELGVDPWGYDVPEEYMSDAWYEHRR